MILTLSSPGAMLERQNATFAVTTEGEPTSVSPHRLRAIHVRKPATLTSAALLLAAEHDIPVLLFNAAGKVMARLWQPHYGSHVRIRHHQLDYSKTMQAMHWVAEGLTRKAQAQQQLLLNLAGKLPEHAAILEAAATQIADRLAHPEGDLAPEQLRALEAQHSRIYWGAYFSALATGSEPVRRTRQPAEDPLNALLNYGYGMLYAEVETAVLTAGLDPQIGILHREEYGKPAFVFDAIEPYRCWVDELVAELAIQKAIKATWFEPKPASKKSAGGQQGQAAGYWLNREAKQVIIPAWAESLGRTLKVKRKQVKRRDLLQQQMTELAQYLLNDYKPKENDPRGDV